MPKLTVKLGCPRCGFPANASLENDDCQEFLLFICPKCHSNVVYYDQKLDVISDRLLAKLVHRKKLKTCGVLKATPNFQRDASQPISEDDIINLRIALGTSDSIESFISNFSKK
jgi:predicted RNA-binding Zn-ribbon protein involved in translation (DUF1610 family)